MVNEKLKELMSQKGVRPGRVCAETGIARSTMWQWMHGVCNPGAEKLLVLAQYFGVALEELIGQ